MFLESVIKTISSVIEAKNKAIEKERKASCCKWNNNKPCPSKVEITKGVNGYGVKLADGSLECCKVRQQHVAIAKAIVDGKMPIDKSSNIVAQAQRQLDEHKEAYPEEYRHMFGDNDEISYRPNTTL